MAFEWPWQKSQSGQTHAQRFTNRYGDRSNQGEYWSWYDRNFQNPASTIGGFASAARTKAVQLSIGQLAARQAVRYGPPVVAGGLVTAAVPWAAKQFGTAAETASDSGGEALRNLSGGVRDAGLALAIPAALILVGVVVLRKVK